MIDLTNKKYVFFNKDKYSKIASDLEIAKLELSDLENQVENVKLEAGTVLTSLDRKISTVLDQAGEIADEFNLQIKDLYSSFDPAIYSSWESNVWKAWKPTGLSLPTAIRLGDIVHDDEFGSIPLQIPALLNLVQGANVNIVESTREELSQSIAVMHTLILRLASTMPHHSKFTLLDPAGLGKSFPMRRLLPGVRKTTEDPWDAIRGVLQDIQRINETVLDMHAEEFSELPEDVRVNEKFEFIFAANFPEGYDRRSIDGLKTIAATGPTSGKYLFIQLNQDSDFPRDFNLNEFGEIQYIPTESYSLNNTSELVLDRPPSANFVKSITETLSQMKPPEVKVGWGEVAGLPGQEWWQEKADRGISAPIGKSGSQHKVELWFGVNEHGRPCAHGMIGAMTGSGKSNLFHSLIISMAIRYSPRELQFFLIDGKDGVEFSPYKKLPHASVVSLNSSPELSRSVLKTLIEEKETRNQLFAECGVQDLASYRDAGSPKGNIPRYLLLIDEYQELFDGDIDNEASNWLLQLTQQGRSVGIHLLLASQSFGAPGLINQSSIFGNIHLRVAMQMTQSAIDSLTEFGRAGKALISSCDLPGKVVVNDQSGDDNANKVGKVALLDKADRDALIEELSEKALTHGLSRRELHTVVLDGNKQPLINDSSPLRTLAELDSWPNQKVLSKLAIMDGLDGGFGLSDWIVEDDPQPIVFGQEFNIRNQLVANLCRRPGQNVLLASGAAKIRAGLAIATIISSVLTRRPEELKITVLDCSPIGSSQESVYRALKNTLDKSNYQTNIIRDRSMIAEWITSSANTIRNKLSTEKQRHLILLIEPDRETVLRKPSSPYDTPSQESQALSDLLAFGPEQGQHVILSCSGANALNFLVDPRTELQRFSHRVVMQVNEDDSYTLTRQRAASRLQSGGPVPIVGYYMNSDTAFSSVFKPFSLENEEQFEDDCGALLERVLNKVENLQNQSEEVANCGN